MFRKIFLLMILSGIFVFTNYLQAKTERKIRIVCLGDSITLAARVKRTESFIGILEERFKNWTCSVQFENAGISGDTTTGGMHRLNKTILSSNPDIVTIMFGCNDSYKTKKMKGSRIPLEKYKNNLNTIIDSLKKEDIIPVLMTTTPTLTRNNIVNPYVYAMRDIAKKRNIALVDHFKTWENYKKKGNKLSNILFDYAHPNKEGYIIMTETMYPVILSAVKEIPNKKTQTNLALAKKYVCSDKNPKSDWNAGLTDGKKTAGNSDGKQGGFATGKSPIFPKNVTIDLEEILPIAKVIVYNMKKYGTKTVEVSLSEDGKEFKKVGTQEFKKADGSVYQYKFPQQKARFVKIAFLDYYKTGLNPNYMFLREVEVY